MGHKGQGLLDALMFRRVQAMADRLEQGGVAPWPDEVDHGSHICAMAAVTEGRYARVYRNPRHTRCADPQGLFVVAAAAVINYRDSGPDEGWMPLEDGTGHVTLLSDRYADMLKDERAVIPVSEMPRLDAPARGGRCDRRRHRL